MLAAMTDCGGFLPGYQAWIIFGVLVLVLGYFSLIRPFLKKSTFFWRIMGGLLFLGGMFVLFLLTVGLLVDSCAEISKPMFEYDFGITVNSREQANDLMYAYLSEMFADVKNKTRVNQLIEETLERGVDTG